MRNATGPAGKAKAVVLATAVGMTTQFAVAGPDDALLQPFDTRLAPASRPAADEHVTVHGSLYRVAPMPGYRDGVMPWDVARAVHDPRTGADTTMFGNAYTLGSPLGSDERSSETGGAFAFVAPRHP